jgi:hypothetical protein
VPTRPGGRRIAPLVALAAIGLLAVALAVAAGGISGPVEDGDTIDRGSALARGAVGAAIGLALFGVALLIARRAGRLPDHRLTAALLVAAAALCFAFGALTGVGSATPDDAGPGNAPPTTRTDEAPTPIGSDAQASFLDSDRDGVPDRDDAGNRIVVIDVDGDGRPDGTLVACPGSAPIGGTDGTDRPPGRVPIDNSCDGTIDSYVTWSSSMLVAPGLPPVINQPDPSGSVPPTTAREQERGDGSSSGAVLITLLLLLGGAVLVGAIVWLVRWLARRSAPASDTPAEPHAPVDARAVDAALENSIETLLGHPDPRLAIRAAYAVLLDALAEAGFPRHVAETPAEHLERCLRGLQVQAEPMRRLLELFAVARFSTHAMTEEDRAAALQALQASRAQLPSTSTFPPPAVPVP